MSNTEKHEYILYILKDIANEKDNSAICLLKKHLKHWVNQYFNSQKESKSLIPNCMTIQAIGCIRANICTLEELDKENECYYKKLNAFIETSMKSEIEKMGKKYKTFWKYNK